MKKSAARISTRMPSKASIRMTTRMPPSFLSHGFTNHMGLLSRGCSIMWTSYHMDSLYHAIPKNNAKRRSVVKCGISHDGIFL